MSAVDRPVTVPGSAPWPVATLMLPSRAAAQLARSHKQRALRARFRGLSPVYRRPTPDAGRFPSLNAVAGIGPRREHKEGLMRMTRADVQARPPASGTLQSWGVVLPRGTHWRELSPVQHRAMIVRGVIQFGLLAVTLNDLRRRGRAQVRGPKLVWAVVCCTNYLGAGPLLYLVVGRRRRQRFPEVGAISRIWP